MITYRYSIILVTNLVDFVRMHSSFLQVTNEMNESIKVVGLYHFTCLDNGSVIFFNLNYSTLLDGRLQWKNYIFLYISFCFKA